MIPVTFSGCFGWWHQGHGNVGVVMCAALGHENMIAHRGWRQLAEDLSFQGLHVLRFDYPGTGDSAGDESDQDHLQVWRDSVVDAAAYLRSIAGVEEVILVGLRIGATLAVLANQDMEHVAGVVCLAPVLTGKGYVRELRLLANAWREANVHTRSEGVARHLDVLGSRLADDTVKALLKVDLRHLSVAPRRLLIMGPGNAVVAGDVERHLRQLGCQVDNEEFPDLGDYLEDFISSRTPDVTFSRVITWCKRLVSSPHVIDFERSRQVLARGQAVAMIAATPGFQETPVSFGIQDGLFGILCSPTDRDISGQSPVIMLNTGFGRHVGDGRMFTTLARRLAASGVTSLRMDLAGFGDSRAIKDGDGNPYGPNTASDVVAAIDLLDGLGYANPRILGVCSGAFSAFQTAIREDRVRGLVLVNIQKFAWEGNISLKVKNRQQRRPLGFYLQAVTDRRAWRRLRRGEVAVGAIALALSRRIFQVVHNRLLSSLERLTGWQTSTGQVSRWFQELNARQVRVDMFYTEDDPGLAELALQLGRNGSRLRRLKHGRLHVLDGADHALLDHTARHHFIEEAVKLLRPGDADMADRPTRPAADAEHDVPVEAVGR